MDFDYSPKTRRHRPHASWNFRPYRDEAGTLDTGLYFQANDRKGTSAASVGPDGSFTLILAEGSYRFEMSALPAGTFIKSIRYGATDLSNQTFNFTRDVAIADLTVTVGSRP